MTDAEALLWHQVRDRNLGGWKFRRHQAQGRYILDFYCHDNGLAIEVDGGQHFEDAGQSNDKERDDWLRSKGIRVLRFTNLEVLTETNLVLEQILLALSESRPHPGPLPEGEGIIR
jgi:very-short-patch-repair endonuclease